LIEDLDRAPKELLAALRPILEGKPVHVSTHRAPVRSADGFKLFATATSAGSLPMDDPRQSDSKALDLQSHGASERLLLPQSLHGLARLFVPVATRPLDPGTGELEFLMKQLCPTLPPVCVDLLLQSFDALDRIIGGTLVESELLAASLSNSSSSSSLVTSPSVHSRAPTIRDLLKVCRRLLLNELVVTADAESGFVSTAVKEAIVCELVDVMVVGSANESFIQQAARGLGADPVRLLALSRPPPSPLSITPRAVSSQAQFGSCARRTLRSNFGSTPRPSSSTTPV
jgi:hypothetical protein